MFISFILFKDFPQLKYGFSDRRDGSMNRRLEKKNRDSYFRKVSIDPSRVVTADLAHGGNAETVTESEANTFIQNADGLIANTKNLFLSATGADCFLLYFYDPKNGAFGIAHVGWRGLLADVVKNTVDFFAKSFGSLPQEILVALSPGIQACHFEISPNDKVKYQEYPSFIFEREEKIFIDLAGIIKFQLLDKGIIEKNIENCGVCTHCNEKEFFSYRRDKPKEVQVMVGYIGLV